VAKHCRRGRVPADMPVSSGALCAAGSGAHQPLESEGDLLRRDRNVSRDIEPFRLTSCSSISELTMPSPRSILRVQGEPCPHDPPRPGGLYSRHPPAHVPHVRRPPRNGLSQHLLPDHPGSGRGLSCEMVPCTPPGRVISWSRAFRIRSCCRMTSGLPNERGHELYASILARYLDGIL